MSISSKAHRDARKRKLAKARNAVHVAAPAIEAHAELRNAQGELLGGIVRREGEWTLGLDGKIVGGSESAARVLVMLQRAAALHEREGTVVQFKCSNTLRAAADQEVSDLGISFEQFAAKLEGELADDNVTRH